MAFVSERWLRHSGRLARNKSRLDKICAILSIIFAMCGGLGLILLSIFDTLRHSHAHNGGGYLLSAIFVCAEYYRLGIHYKEHRVLVLSFWVKLAFIIVELSLAIAFGVTGRGQNRKNQAAVIEWVIAFIFTFYMLSFVMDLYPSIRSDRSTPQGQRLQDPSESDEGYPGEMRERSDSDLEWPLPLPRGATHGYCGWAARLRFCPVNMAHWTYVLPLSGPVPDDLVRLFTEKEDCKALQQPPQKKRKLDVEGVINGDHNLSSSPDYLTVARVTVELNFSSPSCFQPPDPCAVITEIPRIPRLGTKISDGRSQTTLEFRVKGKDISFPDELGTFHDHRFPLRKFDVLPLFDPRKHYPIARSQTLRQDPSNQLSYLLEIKILWANLPILSEKSTRIAAEVLSEAFGDQIKIPNGFNSGQDPLTPAEFYDSVYVPPKDMDLPEVQELDQINCTLFPFQRRAVQWLLERECIVSSNAHPTSELPLSFHEATDADGRKCYVSPLFKVVATDLSAWPNPERNLRGGILAEEMGLGKTVEMLALICAHRRPSIETNSLATNDPNSPALLPAKTTLIIAPDAILEQWKQEIAAHAPGLRFMHYKGLKGCKMTDETLISMLRFHDIVLVTYTVLRSEIHYAEDPPDRPLRHKRKIPRRKSPLVQISWWRVCIDEAQMVESGTSSAAKVARLVPRCNSWAMTGTPLRKDMKDLFGLLLFLDYQPFSSSANVWLRLCSDYKSVFKSIVGTIALRHNKHMIRDELQLPKQKRVVITIPFIPIEEQHYTQLFQQMCDECGLTTTGGPATDDWNPDSKVVLDKMRSWLVKLRRACLHPEVGPGPRRPFGGDGPLRSVSDVLEVMIYQNETQIRAEERLLLLSQIRRGQLMENAIKPNESLKIWQEARSHVQQIVKACRDELQAELKKGSDKPSDEVLSVKADSEDEEGEDDGEAEAEQHNRIKTSRQRLRAALEVEHICEFFIANAYYQIKSDPERTEPDSDESKALEKLEGEGYERAKLIRREILRETIRKVNKHINRLQGKLKKDGLVLIPELQPSVSETGLESLRFLDDFETFCDVIKPQTDAFNKWLNHMAKLLLQALVDEEDAGELVGDEYESSTKHQDEMYVYMEALRIISAQHFDAITGQSNTLILHETRQAFDRAEVGEGPAPELYVSLVKKCQELRVPRSKGSLRGMVTGLRNLLVTLEHREIQGSSRAHIETAITQALLQDVSRVSSEQSKIQPAMERQLDLFRTVMNHRLDYYRQLQQISDTVAPYDEESKGQPLDQERFDQLLGDEAQHATKISTLKSKHRYLIHLRDESGADESTRICVICQASFEIGVLTVCGHKYCKECLQFWYRQHRTCPTCKQHLKPNDFHQISYKPREIVAQEENISHPTEAGHSKNQIYSDVSSGILQEIRNVDIMGSFGTKIDTLAQHLIWLREHDPGAKSIVFSQYKPFLGILSAAFSRFRIGYSSIDQPRGIESFKSDPTKECFLLHAKAHSSGLNLVNATHVILCEPLINTAIELQAIARVHRIGQHRETTVWMYLVADTVEESIYDISVSRRLAHIAQRRDISKKEARQFTLTLNGNGTHGNGPEHVSDRVAGVRVDDETQQLSENIIEAANTLEMQTATLGKLLSGPGDEGERVADHDLWQCLFGKPKKAVDMPAGGPMDLGALEDIQNNVGRMLRANAADRRNNGA
ncbi:hypothetical protein FQN57_007133 [Myotisia sp. PD_48]|nr:hypothetical protein FQN57_007133 [Myotisia sp. PD_48]